MIRKLILSVLTLSSLNTFSSEKAVLGLIESGNVNSFTSEGRFLEILNSEKKILDGYTSRFKMIYPRFDIDLLYTKIIRDEEYKYEFFFDLDSRKCLFVKNKHQNIKKLQSCDENIRICLREKGGNIDSGDYKECMLQNKQCKVLFSLNKGKEIDIKYCNTLYGRKL